MNKKQLQQIKDRIREYVLEYGHLCWYSTKDAEIFYKDLIALLEDEGVFDGQKD